MEEKIFPARTQKINRENIGEKLLRMQLSLINKTMMDVIDNDKWRFQFTLTLEQHTKFKGQAIKLIKKVFHCNRQKAENAFDEFYKQFGLRLKG